MKRLLTIDGLPVVDATAPLVLDVVKTDIDMRRRRDPECCALSEAVKRELGAPRALTYLRTLYVLRGSFALSNAMPHAAFAWFREDDTWLANTPPISPSR